MNRLLSCLMLALVVAPCTATAATRLSGTVTAQRSDGPDHLGLWEYTILVEWELPASPITALDVWLPLDNCECSCEDNLFRFANPSGFMAGSDSRLPCTQQLLGTYSCDGGMPDSRELVRFVTLEADACPTGLSGTGVLTFFSMFGPGPEETLAPITARSAGTSVNGRLTGMMPLCNSTSCTALPVEARTWSLIKTVYR